MSSEFEILFSRSITSLNLIEISFKTYSFLESRKLVVRFWLHWRLPEGIHFHRRVWKNAFYNFKLYIPLEGFRYFSRGFIIPLEGFRYLSRGFIIPLEGFRYLSRGFIIPLEGFRYLSRGFIIPLEGFRYLSRTDLNPPVDCKSLFVRFHIEKSDFSNPSSENEISPLVSSIIEINYFYYELLWISFLFLYEPIYVFYLQQ